MPSLQEIREFNDSIVRLGNEPEVISRWGEEIEELPEPDQGLDTDLSSLLADTGDLATATDLPDTEPTEPDIGAPDLSDLFGDDLSGGVETDADEIGLPPDSGTEVSMGAELSADIEPTSDFEPPEIDVEAGTEAEAEPSVEAGPPVDLGEADRSEPIGVSTADEGDFSDFEALLSDEPIAAAAAVDETLEAGVPDEGETPAAVEAEPVEEEVPPEDLGGLEISDEDFSFDDEAFSFGDEAAAEPPALPPVDDIFAMPEEPAAESEAPQGEEESFPSTDDLGAYEFSDEEFEMPEPPAADDGFTFEEPAVPGAESPPDEEEPGPTFAELPDISGGEEPEDLEEVDAAGIDEFSLGDFGAEFGLTSETVPDTEEDLNPALSIPAVAAAPSGGGPSGFELSDAEFESMQATLASLPLNLKLEVESIVTEAKGTTDQVEQLIRRLANGESPADIAAYAGKILGKQIRIPRGYEKRTGLEFEAERQGFAYQFRENILPILRLAAIIAVAVGILAVAGYHLIFRPLYGRSLYRDGIEFISQDQYTLGNQTFARAEKVWPSTKWFYTYAEAFVGERQYLLAAEKYEQLIFGMTEEERDFYNERLAAGEYFNIARVRSPEKRAILDYAHLESETLGDFERADRLLQLILVDNLNDYDARLAVGDNFMRWAETDPGKYEDAREAYATLMERHGQTDELLFRMLRYFIRTDNLQEVLTLRDLFQADTRLSVEADAYAEMAGYLIDQGQLDDIEEILFRALDADRFIPDIHYNLARFYRLIEAQGEEKLALATARRLLEATSPLTPRLRGMLVDTITRIGENDYDAEQYLEAQERFGEAIAVYEEGVRRRALGPDPKYARAYAHYGDILYYVGREYDDALRYFNRAEENGYDDPNQDYKQGFVLYRDDQLESALSEFREAAQDPSASTNALLWATGNTYYRRGNYFAAQAYYLELLERVRHQRDSIRTLLVDEDPAHQSVVMYLIRLNNNLGVTLNKLSAATGDPDLYAQGLIYLTESIEYSENYRRDPETLTRSSGVNLAYLNQRGILYPTPDYSLQIYTELPEDLDDLVF